MANRPKSRLELMRGKVQSEHAVGLVQKLDELNSRNLRMEEEQKEAENHVNSLFEKRWKDPLWKSELAMFAGSHGCEDSRRESIRRGYFSSFLKELQDSKRPVKPQQKK